MTIDQNNQRRLAGAVSNRAPTYQDRIASFTRLTGGGSAPANLAGEAGQSRLHPCL